MRKKAHPKLPGPPPQVQALTPEEEQELDFDVCCCIEEIESILLSKPTEKQKKMAEVSLKILKNPSEIYIKKKQIMRQWFGDYRSKFEGKKRQVIASLNEDKFTLKKAKASEKSVCFRKHKLGNRNVTNNCESTTDSSDNKDGFKDTSNSFKFGF